MKNSHIQWTDHTQNFWIGCTKVSPGCAHCYAEARDIRFTGGIHWGKNAPRQRTSASNWNEPRRWNRAYEKRAYEAQECGPSGLHRPPPDMPPRPRVFCASLSDIFDDEVPISWFADMWQVINECQNLDWQLLTKRPENWRPRLEECIRVALTGGEHGPRAMLERWLAGEAPPNVWMGTSVENQECADERIPLLLSIPAKVRFLSCEPLLGPIVIPLADWLGIQWCIIGGESGPGARPFNVEWARSLIGQCRAVGAAPFIKQLGAASGLPLRDRKGGDMSEWADDLCVREFPCDALEAPHR